MLPALIFDLDGTLVDSTEDLATATNLTLTELGLPLHTVDEVRRFVGDGARMLLKRALPEDRWDALDDALERFMVHYQAHLVDRTAPYDGIAEMLEGLDGVPKAIASNKPERFIRPILETLGWADLFAPIVGGDSLPERKPHPSMILSVCEQLGVPPADTLMVGDSVQDIGAGLAAGTETCGVSWGFRPGALLIDAGAHRVIDEPSELLKIVRQQ